MLCHYTSMPALTSILKSINVNDKEKSLIMWASSIYAMNDPTEIILPTIVDNECTQCYRDLEIIHTPEEIATRKIVSWGTLCAAVGAYLKNGSYYYEKEQRFVLFDETYSKREFRNSIHGNIISYLEVLIPLAAIKEIIVGPCTDTNITYSGLIPLLKNKNIDIEIHKSQIPYRII